jgi:exonuclease VII small subunit
MDPYRVAYEQAMTELNEITRRFEHLRMQKVQIENLINAFRPLIENSDQHAGSIAG